MLCHDSHTVRTRCVAVVSKPPSCPVDTQVYRNSFIYCGIPKNGCSHWRRMIYRAQDFDVAFSHSHLIHRPPVFLNNLTTLSHIATGGINHARGIVNSRSFFSFVIVRDPFARLLSAWLDKKGVLTTHIHDEDIQRLEVACSSLGACMRLCVCRVVNLWVWGGHGMV